MIRVKKNLKNYFLEIGKLVLPGNEPDFFILGAQKCGTSSLHFYLEQHPSILGGATKEVGYFHRDIYFDKNHLEYKRDFLGSRHRIYMDSTPEYLYHPETARQIFEVLPKTKLIVLIREPVKRAYSAWNHYRQYFETGLYIEGIKNKPRRPGNLLYEKFYHDRKHFPIFRECIDIELELIHKNIGFEPALLRRGLYLAQLKEYWEYFGKDQIMIIGFQDLVKDTVNTLRAITAFIGVKDINWKKKILKPTHVREYTEPMINEDREVCEHFFAKPNQELFEAIDKVNW